MPASVATSRTTRNSRAAAEGGLPGALPSARAALRTPEDSRGLPSDLSQGSVVGQRLLLDGSPPGRRALSTRGTPRDRFREERRQAAELALEKDRMGGGTGSVEGSEEGEFMPETQGEAKASLAEP